MSLFSGKPFIIALIYAALFISGVCFVFYGNHTSYITHAYLVGWLFLLPFTFLAVWWQRKTSYQNGISGRNAAKEGLKFVMIVIVLLVIFQAVFFELSFKTYKINYIETIGTKVLTEQIKMGKIKLTEAQIPQTIAEDVSGVTLFKEITSVVFKYIFYGIFSSFLAAVALKRST